MAEMAVIDPDFEPQSRPRSCTWPMNRPNISVNKSQKQDGENSIKLEATIEECGSQELIAEQNTQAVLGVVKQENTQDTIGAMSPTTMFQTADYSSGLLGSPNGGLVSDLSSILHQTSSTADGLGNLGDPPAYGVSNVKSNFFDNSTISRSQDESQLDATPSTASPDVAMTTGVSTPVTTTTKAKPSTRKNAWGNMSYADLITQGIESSPDKRLTLAQIYDWMVKNVPYFKDKGDSNSSAGWKNSIRHNLSLHSKFRRIQNEGTGKSSWWVINYDAKPGKSPRRRATSMESSNSKIGRSRRQALMKQKEMLKKEKAKQEGSPWAKSPNADGSQDFEHRNKSFTNEFRNRTSSNASSVGGRVSPVRSFLTQDLEDDGPPPLSPLSSSYTSPNTLTELFGSHPGDSYNLDQLNSPSEPLHNDLLESIAGMDMLNPSSPLSQNSSATSTNNEKTNIYLNTIGNTSQTNSTSSVNKAVLSSPNLASLLKGSGSSSNLLSANSALKQVDVSNVTPRARANTMPRLQPSTKYNFADTPQTLMGTEVKNQDTLFTSYKPQEPGLSSSPCNVYINSMGQYQTQSEPQNVPQSGNMQRNFDARTGLSNQANQQKTLYQLLENPSHPNSVSHLQQAAPFQRTAMQQVNNMAPTQTSQQHSVLDGQIGLQAFPQQYDKQTMAQVEQSQAQQQMNDSNLIQMNQGKFPSDIDLDNQDLFDPGSSLDFEQMLQDMDVVSNEPFGMEFSNYGFFPDTGNMNVPTNDLDNPMDTGACGINKPSLNRQQQQVNFQFQANQMNSQQQQQIGMQMNPGAHQQPFQAQDVRFCQPQPQPQQQRTMYGDMGAFPGGSGGVIADQRQGIPVPVNNPMMGGGNFGQQYVQPHPNLRPESSVTSMGSYHM